MADITRTADVFIEAPVPAWSRLRWDSPWWLRQRPYCRPTRRRRAPRLELAVVTINSIGTDVNGSGLSTLSPVPPISNCVGKLVVMCVAFASATPTVDSITGATYYLAGKAAADWRISVWIKNGEAAEPTPTVNIGSSTNNVGAWIFVLDIASGSFPIISADGQGVLGTNTNVRTLQTNLWYEDLTVVGGGFAIQFGEKATTGAGWTFTSVDLSAGYTAAGNTVKTTGANNGVGAAQLKNAATVFGSDIAGNTVAINTNATSGTAVSLTIEFSTAPPVTPVTPQGNRIYILP